MPALHCFLFKIIIMMFCDVMLCFEKDVVVVVVWSGVVLREVMCSSEG